mgnify:FL=1
MFGGNLNVKYKEMGVHWPPRIIFDRFYTVGQKDNTGNYTTTQDNKGNYSTNKHFVFSKDSSFTAASTSSIWRPPSWKDPDPINNDVQIDTNPWATSNIKYARKGPLSEFPA